MVTTVGFGGKCPGKHSAFCPALCTVGSGPRLSTLQVPGKAGNVKQDGIGPESCLEKMEGRLFQAPILLCLRPSVSVSVGV